MVLSFTLSAFYRLDLQTLASGQFIYPKLCLYPCLIKWDGRCASNVDRWLQHRPCLCLIGALSIIRFRNAVKETRDVGFIFFTMAIGMAVGTKFYLLAVIAAVIISLVILIMTRFNWFCALSSARSSHPGTECCTL